MTDFLIGALKNGLSGKGIHMNPEQAVDGLTAEQAKMKTRDDCHSCYQILHHIIFWQDLMLEALRGKDVNWPKTNEPSWGNNEELKTSEDWEMLVSRFKFGLEEARSFAENSESLEPLPAWPGVSIGRALMVFAQHNAYHIGELVATRKGLGFWPPPGKSQTLF